MRIFATLVLFSALLFGQAPPGVQATPGPASVGAPVSAPAAPASAIAPDAVVIEVAGKKYTAAEMDKLMAALPPQFQQAARSQPQVLNQVFLMQRLAEDAEKDGLDKQEPYKTTLELMRAQLLSQAQLTKLQAATAVPKEEQEKYYQDHPEKFRQAKVRVIYVAFNPAPDKAAADAKKLPTEAEAKAKIEDLRKQIVGGADFGKIARENSDDKTSAAKDGDFGVITPKSAYPAPIKTAVFALQQGQVSEPVRQPNGFYLIRADEMSTLSFDAVGTEVLQDLRQERFTEFMKGLQAQYTVKVENPAYFTPRQPPQLQQVR